MPKDEKIRVAIIEYIKKNNLHRGDKLPSEPEFIAILNVSRASFREGIRLLKEEGLVVTKQGDGSYISGDISAISANLNYNMSFTSMIEAVGKVPGVRFYERKIIKSDEEKAEPLQIPLNTSIISCRRIRLADGDPVALSEDYIPPRLVEDFLSIQDENISLFKFLEEERGLQIGNSLTELTPILCPPEWAEQLECEPKSALLHMKHIIYDVDGIPLLLGNDYIKPNWIHIRINRKKITH